MTPLPRWVPILSFLLGVGLLVAGWLTTTAADGEVPVIVGEGGAIAAIVAGSILFAKLVGPALGALAKTAEPGGRDSFRDGEMHAMLTGAHDAIKEIEQLLRQVVDGQRELIVANRQGFAALQHGVQEHDDRVKDAVETIIAHVVDPTRRRTK